MSNLKENIKAQIIEKITKDLSIDLSDLNAVWVKQPELMMTYGSKMAEAERLATEEKRRVEALPATLYNIIRSDRAMSGTKTSETGIDSMVKQVERLYSGEDGDLNLNTTFIQSLPEKVETISRTLSAARVSYEHNKEIYEIFKAAVEALRHRRDMVVQASKKSILDYEYLNAGSFAEKK
ncbi:hypothetical protein V5085_11015 [Moellerella wisconsensis]|uniref:hypothetical protein n=1 Tax=Moellerella wisconsensis TaxID=158849 RepID=UPI00307617DA